MRERVPNDSDPKNTGSIRKRFFSKRKEASTFFAANSQSEIVDQFELFSGPENKNPHTWDLQHIIHACLYPEAKTGNEIKFYKKTLTAVCDHNNDSPDNPDYEESEETHVMVVVYGKHFDLTLILKSQPDFKQIYLTPQQLDNYTAYFSKPLSLPSIAILKRQFHLPADLLPAEEQALRNWSGPLYVNIQCLLQYKNYPSKLLNDLRWVLPTIAVMCNSFKRPLKNKKHCVTEGRRIELYNEGVFAQRKKNYVEKKPTVNCGFTAASANGTYNPTSILDKKTIVKVQQSSSLFPCLRSIAQQSKYYDEKEILAQPFQQFIFIPDDASTTKNHDHWLAKPVRSINPDECAYQADLTDEEREEIRKKSNELMLISILHPLCQHRFTKNKIKDKEIINLAIDVIKKAIATINSTANINEKAVIDEAVKLIQQVFSADIKERSSTSLTVSKKTQHVIAQTIAALNETKRQLHVLPSHDMHNKPTFKN